MITILASVVAWILPVEPSQSPEPVSNTTPKADEGINLGRTAFSPGTYIFMWANAVEEISLPIKIGGDKDCLYEFVDRDGYSKQFWLNCSIVDNTTIKIGKSTKLVFENGTYYLLKERRTGIKRNEVDVLPKDAPAIMEVFLFSDPDYSIWFDGYLTLIDLKGNLKTKRINGYTPERIPIIDPDVKCISLDVSKRKSDFSNMLYVVVYQPLTGKVLNHEYTEESVLMEACR